MIVLGFTCALLDKVNFGRVCGKNSDIRKLIPDKYRVVVPPPSVQYKFAETLGQILKSNYCFKRLDGDQLQSIAEGLCECESCERNKPFVHDKLGHVATCDLKFITHMGLRKLMNNGT